MIQVQMMLGSHEEVAWGQLRSQSIPSNNSQQDGDRDVQMVSNDLVCQAALEDIHIDLLGLWPKLDMAWDLILKLTLQGQKVHVPNWLDEANTMVPFYFRIFQIKKVINENRLWKKSFDDRLNLNYYSWVKSDRTFLPWHEDSSPALFSNSFQLSYFCR